eukprot:12413821-Karenia_brevis.AAC.1
MDAAGLIAYAHGSALRLVSDKGAKHHSGLQVASRDKSLPLHSRLRRQLFQVDVAFSWSRHITSVKV